MLLKMWNACVHKKHAELQLASMTLFEKKFNFFFCLYPTLVRDLLCTDTHTSTNIVSD